MQQRPTLVQQQPQAIQILRAYTPGFTQYGACTCFNAPENCPCLSVLSCFADTEAVRERVAGSGFLYLTENGVMYNRAKAGNRDRCADCLPYQFCACKARDQIELVPWDSGSYEYIEKKKWCTGCDWCTKYGCGLLGPCYMSCGSCWFKCCPGLNKGWCKVCFMETCDERKQYCHGGDGTLVLFTVTYCCGMCVRAVPGFCFFCPTPCAPLGRKMPCCSMPTFHEVYLHGDTEADRFIADVKAEFAKRQQTVKFQDF